MQLCSTEYFNVESQRVMHVEREKVEQNTWWWPKSDTNYDNMTLTCFKLSNMSFIENLQKLFCLYIKTEDWIEYASSIWANILRGEAKFGVEKIFFAPILKYILTCCFWVEVSFGKCCVEGRNKTIKKYLKVCIIHAMPLMNLDKTKIEWTLTVSN